MTATAEQLITAAKAPVVLVGMEEALIGYSLRSITLESVAVYSLEKVRDLLLRRGLNNPEIETFIETEYQNRYFGKASPVLV